MPLLKGKKNIGHNIAVEEEHGKPHKQAVAIALKTAGVSKKGKDFTPRGHNCDACGAQLSESSYSGYGNWSYKCPRCKFKYVHGGASLESQLKAQGKKSYLDEDEGDEYDHRFEPDKRLDGRKCKICGGDQPGHMKDSISPVPVEDEEDYNYHPVKGDRVIVDGRQATVLYVGRRWVTVHIDGELSSKDVLPSRIHRAKDSLSTIPIKGTDSGVDEVEQRYQQLKRLDDAKLVALAPRANYVSRGAMIHAVLKQEFGEQLVRLWMLGDVSAGKDTTSPERQELTIDNLKCWIEGPDKDYTYAAGYVDRLGNRKARTGFALKEGAKRWLEASVSGKAKDGMKVFRCKAPNTPARNITAPSEEDAIERYGEMFPNKFSPEDVEVKQLPSRTEDSSVPAYQLTPVPMPAGEHNEHSLAPVRGTDFSSVTHIIKYPSGKYGYVGSVPGDLMDWVEPTSSDVMAGRVHNGKAWRNKTFSSSSEAVSFARSKGANVCSDPKCACAKLINAKDTITPLKTDPLNSVVFKGKPIEVLNEAYRTKSEKEVKKGLGKDSWDDQDDADRWYIQASVSGGVTGSRSAPLKEGNSVKYFNTEQEAQAEASSLNRKMNGPNARAFFNYSVRRGVAYDAQHRSDDLSPIPITQGVKVAPMVKTVPVSKGKDSSSDDAEDLRDALQILAEHNQGLLPKEIVAKHGYSASFVTDVIAGKYGKTKFEIQKYFKEHPWMGGKDAGGEFGGTEPFQLRDGWHLIFKGVVAKPKWSDKGAAEAQLDLLKKGYSTMDVSGNIKHKGSDVINHTSDDPLTEAKLHEIAGDKSRAKDAYKRAEREATDNVTRTQARDGYDACSHHTDHFNHPACGKRVQFTDRARAVDSALLRTRSGERVQVKDAGSSEYVVSPMESFAGGKDVERKRELTVPEKHQLRIAKQTINMPDAMVGILGGMTKQEAVEVIKRLTGKSPKDYYERNEIHDLQPV